MFLHLGQDIIIKTSDIIGIFDLEKTTISKKTRNFLSKMQKENKVISITNDLPKSFIVCCENKNTTVYISQISTATLIKRCDFLNNKGA